MADSDDNMYDEDQESENDLYNDDTASDEYDVMSLQYDEVEEVIISNNHDQTYTILHEQDVLKRQEHDISKVSSILSISQEAATLLLSHYKWNVNDVHEAWFADEENVRKAVGLMDSPVVELSNVEEISCGICFDNYKVDLIKSLVCGHPFCTTCWKAYITTSINDGPGCLTLKCPTPKCRVAVGMNMIVTFASDENKNKYQRYVIRSYIEKNKKIKWCPAPDCECAIEHISGSGSYDVTCNCSHSFCWNCTQEIHRPVDCETVEKWNFKNSNESENTNWILTFTKPCPKCKRPIEKNQGCNTMRCRDPCGFVFCWICLTEYRNHHCNVYYESEKRTTGSIDEEERKRQRAKLMLERYMHYYERWAANHKSREKARADLEQMRSVHLQRLSERQGKTEDQLVFIIEAWQQIIECRRVLKWTYAYGYYLPELELTKKRFFEYLQGEAEAGLERLHGSAEKELFEDYLKEDEIGPWKDFSEFRYKLIGLTGVTRTYFENLVRALENGLADVDSEKAVGSA